MIFVKEVLGDRDHQCEDIADCSQVEQNFMVSRRFRSHMLLGCENKQESLCSNQHASHAFQMRKVLGEDE